MRKAKPPSRDMRELHVDEAYEFWNDAVKALISVLDKHRVAGSGAGYSLYAALADEIEKVKPFQFSRYWQMREWGEQR